MPSKRAAKQPGDRPEWFAKTVHDVAAFFGLTYDHIRRQRWFTEYTKTRRGYYLPDLAARRHAQAIRSPQALPEGDNGEHTSLTAEKLKEKEQDVRRKRRENDQHEGELLPRNEVERAIISWAVRFRTPLLGLSSKIAALVPGSQKATAERMVKDEVRNALIQVRDMQLTDARVEQLILQRADEIRKERTKRRRKRSRV